MQRSSILPAGSRLHFMGIGGYGMNPIARILQAQGYDVSGCDMHESPLVEPLRDLGVPVEIGHSADHLDAYQPDALVISSAIPAHNAEVQQAAAQGIPIYKRADILCQLMHDQIGIAIAGTHGKTTTTGLTVAALRGAGFDPSYIVGGVLQDTGDNAHAGIDGLFVIEADEYDRMYLGLCPRIAVVTTLEMDHPDMFADTAAVLDLFAEFVRLLPDDGLLIAGWDDANARRLAEQRQAAVGGGALTYGLQGGLWTADQIATNAEGGMDFTARYDDQPVVDVSLRLPGLHNVQNALVALAIVAHLEGDLEGAAAGLAAFHGMGRRFEVKGVAQGITIIDDYAHHPTAIRATLNAARLRYPGQTIWAIWQPHTYSRTAALLDEFAASFVSADHVVITDVFRSRDTHDFGVSVEDVLAKMDYHPEAQHVGGLDAVVDHLVLNVMPGDVVIVMSAGDATRVGSDLLALLQAEEANHDHA